MARRDKDEYKQQQLEAARRARSDWELEQGEDGLYDALQHQAMVIGLETVSNSMPDVAVTADTKFDKPDELSLRVGAVSDADINSELTPMWLHNQLFQQHQHRKSGSKDTADWASMTLAQRQRSEILVLSASWLQDQLFPETDRSPAVSQPSQVAASPMEDAKSTQPTFTGPSLRRKETKQLKKQRATQNRALARTMAEEEEAQEAAERTTKKASTRKTVVRTGTTRSA